MNKEKIIEYVLESPHNTNKIILKQMLEDYKGSDGPDVPIVPSEPEYPELTTGSDWFPADSSGNPIHPNAAGENKSYFTSIRIVDSYTPVGDENSSWVVDKNKDGSITVYRKNKELIIAGNGSGKIRVGESAVGMFKDFVNIVNISGLNLLDISKMTVKNLDSCFRKCRALKSVDISAWDASEVTNMGNMFSGCRTLEAVCMPDCELTANPTTVNMFNTCLSLKQVNFSRGLKNVSSGTFLACRSLENVHGLSEVTSIGDTAFHYTPVAISDLDGSKINSVGNYGFGFSGIEDATDLSGVSLDNVGTLGTRNKRWDSAELQAIQGINVPDVYLKVVIQESQLGYTDLVYGTDSEGNPATVAGWGCAAFAAYHAWQYINDTPMEFRKWYNEILDKDQSFSSTNNLSDIMEKVIAKLGWSLEAMEYVSGSTQKQKIIDKLNEGKPVLTVLRGVGGSWHAIAIIGADSKTGKFIGVDSGFPDTGIEISFAFEDVYDSSVANIDGSKEFDRIYLINY